MPNAIFGANEFTVEELDALFQDDDAQQETPPATEDGTTNATDDAGTSEGSNPVDTTKAFARRLRESTEKARKEERENIAKSLGYESYESMQRERERKLLEDKGFNPDDLNPTIDEIVKQRLDNDPRMVELSNLRAQSEKEFAKQELAEITKLTDGEITSLTQLPPEVIESWRTKGSLTAAYMEHEGVKLINKLKSGHSKGSTGHLANPTGSVPSQPKTRLLTAEEKQMWKVFHPGISDEELNKKTINI